MLRKNEHAEKLPLSSCRVKEAGKESAELTESRGKVTRSPLYRRENPFLLPFSSIGRPDSMRAFFSSNSARWRSN